MPNILVVDDDNDLFILLRDFFAGTEFQLDRTVDAESGLSRLFAAPGREHNIIGLS